MKFIQVLLVALLTVVVSSCGKGKVETKAEKCTRLVETIIISSKKEIPKMLPGRRKRATIMVVMLEKNKENFVRTCLQKPDAAIDNMFKNNQPKN